MGELLLLYGFVIDRNLFDEVDMAALDSYRYAEKISAANERAALTVLRDGCLAALDGYPETEEEDQKLMENARMFAALPRNARMAVKLRRNEKRILLRTIRTCETAMDALMGMTVEAMEGGGL